MQKKKILIVEDDHDIGYLYSFHLSEKYELTIALNGKEGLEKFRQDSYDLVVTDIQYQK